MIAKKEGIKEIDIINLNSEYLSDKNQILKLIQKLLKYMLSLILQD